jgi:hypothetical protein
MPGELVKLGLASDRLAASGAEPAALAPATLSVPGR